jgi:hypothetical protein
MGKAAAVKDQIHGIDEEKVDRASVLAGLERCGISISDETRESLPECVRVLKEHFADLERKNPKDIVTCDNCGADSTGEFDLCPFCGVGEDGAQAGEPEPEPEPTDEDGAGDPDEADGGRGFEPGDAEDQTGTRVPVSDATIPAPAPEGGKLVKLERKKKGSTAVVVAPAPGMIEIAKPPKGMLADPIVDQYVAEFQYLRRGMAAGSWLIADKLAQGDIKGVYKQRKLLDGKAAYKNFDQFVKSELGMSRKYMQELLRMRDDFTAKEFEEYGVTRLRVVMQAAPGEKAAALAKLKSGASRREVERTLSLTGRTKDKPEGKPKAAETGKITVAVAEGKTKLPFVLKVGSGKDAEERPAKQMTDKPYARFKLANDTVLFVTLSKNSDGEIVGLFDVRRVDPVK